MSCNEKDCDNKALYGYKQKSVVYCKEHKKDDMVTVPLKYCEHGKQRSKCKECGGGSICEHGKQRSQCKECGGGSVCEHGRIRSQCKECGGGSICYHGKIRSICKECGGGSICEHGRIRTFCKECGGGSICEHGRVRSLCKECGGSQICEHGKERTKCKECSGSQICYHGKLISYCKDCGGSSLCKTIDCTTFANRKYRGYCLYCFINTFPNEPVVRNYKTKEKEVVDRIKEKYPEFDWKHDKKIENGKSLRRPDLLLDLETHVIIVEIDENKHNQRECICENKRLMEISRDLNYKSMIMLRFNPDSYTNKEGMKILSPWTTNKSGILKINKKQEKEWNERIAILQDTIKYWIENSTDKTVEIIQLFYDMDLDDILSKEFGNMSLS